MAQRVRLTQAGQHSPSPPPTAAVPWWAGPWTWVTLLLVLPGVVCPVGRGLAWQTLAWQFRSAPQALLAEPWRCWSAAWVHLSVQHWWANVLGALLVWAWAWVARMPRQAAWAWALAWPLTHASLQGAPDIHQYGGLSGVLHAGVSVVAVTLLCDRSRPQAARVLAGGVLLGLLIKLVGESAWTTHPVAVPGWDIPVVPLAHASGAVWGAVCAAVAVASARVRSRP